MPAALDVAPCELILVFSLHGPYLLTAELLARLTCVVRCSDRPKYVPASHWWWLFPFRCFPVGLSLNTEQSCRVPCSSPKPLISFCWACSMQPSSWGQWCCCHQAGSVNLGVRAYLEISVYDLNVRKWNGNLTLYLSHANQSISSNEQFKVFFFFLICSCHLWKSGSEFRMLKLGVSACRYSDDSIIRIK